MMLPTRCGAIPGAPRALALVSQPSEWLEPRGALSRRPAPSGIPANLWPPYIDEFLALYDGPGGVKPCVCWECKGLPAPPDPEWTTTRKVMVRTSKRRRRKRKPKAPPPQLDLFGGD